MTIRDAQEFQDGFGGLGGIQRSQLTNLPLDMLDPWVSPEGQRQPFQPYSNVKIQALADNIQKNGVIEPICVRPTPDGRFQIIAGHNRVAASKMARLPAIPALIQQMDDNEAAIRMVDSNLQHREKLLPSEKAFAYKVRLDAINRQGKRSDLTSVPLGPKLNGTRSNEELSEETGDSATQIKRYIRLTYLLDPLLNLVDYEKFSMRAAVHISYLDSTQQDLLLQAMECSKGKAPSMAQAAELRKLAQQGLLDEDAILNVLIGKNGSKSSVLKLPAERISSFFPPNTSAEEMEAEIYQALMSYRKKDQSLPIKGLPSSSTAITDNP